MESKNEINSKIIVFIIKSEEPNSNEIISIEEMGFEVLWINLLSFEFKEEVRLNDEIKIAKFNEIDAFAFNSIKSIKAISSLKYKFSNEKIYLVGNKTSNFFEKTYLIKPEIISNCSADLINEINENYKLSKPINKPNVLWFVNNLTNLHSELKSFQEELLFNITEIEAYKTNPINLQEFQSKYKDNLQVKGNSIYIHYSGSNANSLSNLMDQCNINSYFQSATHIAFGTKTYDELIKISNYNNVPLKLHKCKEPSIQSILELLKELVFN